MSNAHKLTDQQKIDMVKEYLNNPQIRLKDLAQKYNIRETSVSRNLKRRGIKIRNGGRGNAEFQRKYNYNQDYFDKIDCEDKAYFLGLLYADGYNNQKNATVAISLQEDDKSILVSFSKCTQSTRKIVRINHYKKQKKGKPQYRFLLQGRKISDRIAELGCYQKKSLTLKFPTEEQVPNHLLRHFIRGVWDGDGCHSYDSGKYFKIYASLVSSISFCNSFESLIKEKFNLTIHKYLVGKNKKTIRIMFSNRNSIINFLSWIYDDSNFYIQRKYDKYLKIKKINSEKVIRPYNKKAKK